MDIKTKSLNSAIWSLTLQAFLVIIAFASNFIYAKILSPKDFGLFGIVLITTNFLESFSTTGVDAALIQKKNDCESFLDVAWTIQLIRGIILFVIIVTISPFIECFFEEPHVKKFIIIFGISLLIKNTQNIGIIFFRKELVLKKQFVFDVSVKLVSTTTGIILAILLKNVWALIISSIIGSIFQSIISYILIDYRPKFDIDKKKFVILFGFGKWILFSSILSFLFSSADSVFVGKILGITALGFYSFSFRMVKIIFNNLGKAISRVVFPLFSKLQDLQNAFIKAFDLMIDGLCSALMSLLIPTIIFTPELVSLLGSKWLPIIPLIRILAISSVVTALQQGGHFVALKRPDIHFSVKCTSTVTTIILLFPMIKFFNSIGAAYSVLMANILSFLVWYIRSTKLLRLSSFYIIQRILPTILIAFITIFLILHLKTKLIFLNNWTLPAIVVMTISLYSILSYINCYLFHTGPLACIVKFKKYTSYKSNLI